MKDAISRLIEAHTAIVTEQALSEPYLPQRWFQLVDDLCYCIEALLHLGEAFTANQIKSKLGGLQFYFPGPVRFREPALESEQRSFTICEECGMPGKAVRPSGIIYTFCAEHDSAERARLATLEEEYETNTIKGTERTDF
jgi:hypothetical protein